MYAIKWVITVKNWKYCWFFGGPLGANVDHTPQSYSTWGARELENLYINCHQSLFESYINSLALLACHVWGQIKLWWFQKALRWRGADPGSWKLSRLALKWSEQGDKGGAMTGTAIPTNSFIANPVPIHYLLLNWYSHIFFTTPEQSTACEIIDIYTFCPLVGLQGFWEQEPWLAFLLYLSQ